MVGIIETCQKVNSSGLNPTHLMAHLTYQAMEVLCKIKMKYKMITLQNKIKLKQKIVWVQSIFIRKNKEELLQTNHLIISKEKENHCFKETVDLFFNQNTK
mgnify:CR=1 FL=1